MGRLAGTNKKTNHKSLKLNRVPKGNKKKGKRNRVSCCLLHEYFVCLSIRLAIDEVYNEIHDPKFEEVRIRTRIKPLNEDLPGIH